MYVHENNNSVVLTGAVMAADQGLGKNARVTYYPLPTQKDGWSLYSYISINSKNGNNYVLQTLHYEMLTHFKVGVKASDSCSPSFFTNVTIYVSIITKRTTLQLFYFPCRTDPHPEIT